MNLRIDGEKLHFHPARVAQWQMADTWEKAREVYPVYVEVSPVGACNHRCTFCAVDYIGYKSVMLDSPLLKNRLMEMGGELDVKSVMFAGEGEPLLHRNINDIALIASGWMDVAFTTNGILLDRLEVIDECDWIKVSVDAGTAKTYAAIHRTKEKDWDTLWRNIGAAVKRKGNCMIGVQMLLLPENKHEVKLLYDLCDEAGVDYMVAKPYSQHKMSITHEYENYHPFDPFLELFNAPHAASKDCPPGHTKFIYRKESAETKEIPYEKCHATPNFWAYIMASGDVYSCSAYLLDERFCLGNIGRQSFREIWQGDKRRANWEFVRNGLDIHECRVNCRMHRVNLYLTDLVNGVPGKNFI